MSISSSITAEYYSTWDGKYSYAPAFRFSREVLSGTPVSEQTLSRYVSADRNVFHNTDNYHHQFSNLAFLYMLRKYPQIRHLIADIDLTTSRKSRTTNWKMLQIINTAFYRDKEQGSRLHRLLDVYQDDSGFIWDSNCSASAQYHIFMTALLLLYYFETGDGTVKSRLSDAISRCTDFTVGEHFLLFGRGSEQNFGYSALNFIHRNCYFLDEKKENIRRRFIQYYTDASITDDVNIYKFSNLQFDGYGYNNEADYFEIEQWWNTLSKRYNNALTIPRAALSPNSDLFIHTAQGRLFRKIRHYHSLEDVSNTFLNIDASNYLQFNDQEPKYNRYQFPELHLGRVLRLILVVKIFYEIAFKADSGINRRHRLRNLYSKKRFSIFELMYDKDLEYHCDYILIHTILGQLQVSLNRNDWTIKSFKANLLGKLLYVC